MNECIFCQIVKKKILTKIIFENNKNLAFLDIYPISEGHTIVIPKNHYQNIEDIPDEELIETYKLVKNLATKIHKRLNAEGYNILQNNFEAAGQVIKHFHVHIIPRKVKDRKFKVEIPREQANDIDLNRIYELLKE